jgi:hypothetical protein
MCILARWGAVVLEEPILSAFEVAVCTYHSTQCQTLEIWILIFSVQTELDDMDYDFEWKADTLLWGAVIRILTKEEEWYEYGRCQIYQAVPK